MKYILTILSFFMASSLINGQVNEQLSIPLTFPNKSGSLNINIITGSIKVEGYSGNEVLVQAGTSGDTNKHPISNGGPMNRKKGLKKINGSKGFELIAEEKNNVVTIGFDKPNLELEIVVKVPRNFSLNLSTINDGDIIVENVNGNHEISNINGSIDLINIGGSVVANALNDDINVTFNSVTPNTPMAFTNLNGEVNVTFPANLKATLKAKSENGDVLSDFDIKLSNGSSNKSYTKDVKTGLYKITKDEWIKGDINGGGAEIMMKSLNGDLIINKSK
jgi:hypothetical protein